MADCGHYKREWGVLQDEFRNDYGGDMKPSNRPNGLHLKRDRFAWELPNPPDRFILLGNRQEGGLKTDVRAVESRSAFQRGTIS